MQCSTQNSNLFNIDLQYQEKNLIEQLLRTSPTQQGKLEI